MSRQSEPSMQEAFLEKLRKVILQNLSNEYFGIKDLVQEMGVSRSQLHRKLIKATGKSVTQYVREIRLEEALKLLKGEAGTAAEIAYKVGFHSPTYFNKCFHEYYGITPGEVGKKPVVKNLKSEQKEKKTFTSRKWKPIAIISLVIVIVWAGFYIISSTKKDLTHNPGFENPIAIMPLVNNTGDPSYDYLEYGISEMLINALTRSEELTIIDNQIIFEVTGNLERTRFDSVGPDISKEMATMVNSGLYIAGNYLLSGSTFRINLKLVDTESNEVIKTFLAEDKPDSVFSMVGSLSFDIKNHLEIKILEERNEIESIAYAGTSSPEAYRNYIQGLEAFWGGTWVGWDYFNNAMEIDPQFYNAYFYQSLLLSYYGNHSRAKKNMVKAYEGWDKMTVKMQLWVDAFMSQYFEKNPYKSINKLKRVTEIDPLSRLNWYWIGMFYNLVEEYDKALLAFKQIEKINRQLGRWKNHNFYLRYCRTYIRLGEYNKAEKILKEGSRFFPESRYFPYYQAVNALLQNDSASADRFISQYTTALKRSGRITEMGGRFTEPLIMGYEGNIYRAAGQIQKAIEIYREAIELRLKQGPAIDTTWSANNLGGYYLNLGEMLVNDINIEEGMDYIIKAKEPLIQEMGYDHPEILRVYGYGLFKQGNYEQALATLKKAQELITIDDRFFYGDTPKIANLIAEVEEAIASQ